MPKPSRISPETQKAIERVISDTVEKVLGQPKVTDPRRELAKYPQRMTIRQVSVFLNCAENTVFNAVDCGELKAINLARPGSSRRCLRIFRESVAEYEAAQGELQLKAKTNPKSF